MKRAEDFVSGLNLTPEVAELYKLRGVFMDIFAVLEDELHAVIIEWYEIPEVRIEQFEANMLTSATMDTKINTMLKSILKEINSPEFATLRSDIDDINQWRNVIAHGTFVGEDDGIDAVLLRKRNVSIDTRSVSVEILTTRIEEGAELSFRLGDLFRAIMVLHRKEKRRQDRAEPG